MLTSKEILSLLDKHAEEIKKFGVKKIGLFGSYSRDESKEDSDIDIIVELLEVKYAARI